MKIKLLLIALALTLGLVYEPGSSLAAEESVSFFLPGNPLEGSRLFTGKGCLRCHAVYGVGGSAGPDLGQGILKRPLLDIAGVMWNHSPGMAHVFQEQQAVRPQFKPAEMASLLSFLYYLGSLDAPGDASAGARLFREKQCQTCHSLGGKGGTHGPKLDGYSRYASPIYLTASLWNHGKAMAGLMEALRVARPTFEKNDIPDLLAYIRSAGGGVERVYVQPGNPQRGEKLFSEKRCIQCHSIDGRGSRVGPNLQATLKGSLMTIAGAMWNHGPKMWAKMAERGIAVPSLTTEEMSDLTSYLYFLQFVDSPGVAARGRVVYQEKRCGNCHTLPGIGGTVGPDLTAAEKLKTPLEVVTEMWNHASTMEQKMLEESVEWPVFKGGEMADLMAYLLSIRRGAHQPAAQKGSARKVD
jgi:mono/diheme cytochrome c family protein